MSTKSIIISDVEKIGDLGDFLKQNHQITEEERKQEEKQQKDPDAIREIDEPTRKAGCESECKEEAEITDTDAETADQCYACNNPKCQKSDLSRFHLFEIGNDDEIYMICTGCFTAGYRLCLVSREVCHQTEMKTFGNDDAFIKSSYQMLPFETFPDIDTAYKSLGIEYPYQLSYIIVPGNDVYEYNIFN